ncbi:hypothetical protein CRE_08352 [Caenorhabditis remanei]|uniref:Uncharacterized protein n=1 Tax=Caenorhabditis remanei TaxID=31234 RepID=E3MPK4_CAERE|nr:hypothetical protein CRE_08352 [Caenorhabditis remanei]
MELTTAAPVSADQIHIIFTTDDPPPRPVEMYSLTTRYGCSRAQKLGWFLFFLLCVLLVCAGIILYNIYQQSRH